MQYTIQMMCITVSSSKKSHFDGICSARLYKLTIKYKFPSDTTILLYLFNNVCYMFWSYFEHIQALLYII
jgi:hypothetical protein